MAILIGRKAPHFEAKAIVNGGEEKSDFSLDQYLGKKKVCSSFTLKILHLYVRQVCFFRESCEFEKRDTAVVAYSTDTEKSHWGWLQVEKSNGGIKGVTYPIVADTNKTISKNFMC